MNKKGFTLIELLAVILILGIIALIAIPAVNNIITESKKEAAKVSASNYIEAIEKQATLNQLKNEKIIVDGIYTPLELEYYGVKISGTNPSIESNILIEDGQVKDYSISFNDIVVDQDGTSSDSIKGVLGENKKAYANGYTVFFNPVTGDICNETTYLNNASKLGNSGCLKWYIFNDNLGDKVTAILDHNTTKSLAYSTSDTVIDMTPLLTGLSNDTSDWTGLDTIDQTIDGINYTGYRARLISAVEVSKIVGYLEWESLGLKSNSWYYLETRTKTLNTVTGLYGWLIDNTNDCKGHGCYNNLSTGGNGYWTSSILSDQPKYAWQVGSWADVNGEYVSSVAQRGVRPVIYIDRNLLD